MDDTLDGTEDSLDELVLETMNLPLGASIGISSELALDSTGLDVAEVEVKMFEFTISLLDTTIQDCYKLKTLGLVKRMNLVLG